MFLHWVVRYKIFVVGLLVALMSGVAVAGVYAVRKPSELIIIAPLSLGSKLGEATERVMRIALAEREGRAGKYHIRFMPIDVTTFEDADNYDDLNRLDSIVRATTDEQTVAVLGPITTGATMRLLPLISTEGILQVNYTATYPGFVVPNFGGPSEYSSFFPTGNRTYFSLTPHMLQIADVMTKRLAVEQYQKIYMLSDDSEYGGKGIVAIQQAVLQHGGRIVGSSVLTPDSLDSVVAEIVQKQPDCIAFISLPSKVVRTFIDALIAQNAVDCLSGPYLENTYHALYGEDWPRIHTFSFNPNPAASPENNAHIRELFERYEEEYGTKMDVPSAYRAHDAMHFALDAIAASDGTRKGVLEAAHRMHSFETVFGPITFDAYGAATPLTVETMEVIDGIIVEQN